MAGYSFRDRPADGTLDDLWAKAVAIEDARGNRVVAIALDLIAVTGSLSEGVAQRLNDSSGLTRDRILINVSHTHSGPLLYRDRPLTRDLPPNELSKILTYTLVLEDAIVGVAEAALGDLEPGSLHWGTGRAGFGVNRRNNPEGKVPELRAAGQLRGPVDHDVPVLVARGAEGEPKGILFGYSCHATVLNGFQWSGDFPGVAERYLEAAYPGVTALFFAGCGGDINPLPRRHVDLMVGYGQELGRAVENVLAGEMSALTEPLRTAFTHTSLPFDDRPTHTELLRLLRSDVASEQSQARFLLADMLWRRPMPESYDYPVQVWSFGKKLRWIALGGEPVVEYSLRLKSDFGHESTWVSGYSNDVMSYIPSATVYREGGYEGATAMYLNGYPGRWTPDVEERIIFTVHRIIESFNDESPAEHQHTR